MNKNNILKEGKIITLSGAPGCGKSFLTHYILNSGLKIEPLISATTREKRENEIEGIDKFFLSMQEFQEKEKNAEFAVINKVGNNFYAFKKSQINEIKYGKNFITDIHCKDVKSLKEQYPQTISIYIVPSDVERAKKEIKLRHSSDNVNQKLEDIDKQLAFYENNKEIFNYCIINDYTQKVCDNLVKKITELLQ